MYLHLGQDVVVRSRDIVGIFDIENTSVSKITKEYLTDQEKKTPGYQRFFRAAKIIYCVQ